MRFQDFERCLSLLRQYTTDELSSNRTSLSDHQTTLTTERSHLLTTLRTTALNAARANAHANERISGITDGPLATYKSNLRAQQQQSVPSKAALLTVSRITEQKKEIDRLQAAIANNKAQTKLLANRLKMIGRSLETIEEEISQMDDALSVADFLDAQDLTIDSVAAYDTARLFALYQQGGA